jgi:hypothetical protein
MENNVINEYFNRQVQLLIDMRNNVVDHILKYKEENVEIPFQDTINNVYGVKNRENMYNLHSVKYKDSILYFKVYSRETGAMNLWLKEDQLLPDFFQWLFILKEVNNLKEEDN